MLTGAAALLGLLGAGTEAPCGKFCADTSPDQSGEAWFIAFPYVGFVAALCFARYVGATDEAPTNMPRYRANLGILVVASFVVAVLTPRSWEPLRPALIVGGLTSLAFLILGGRLARVWGPARHGGGSGSS
jgi:hypothetical protein